MPRFNMRPLVLLGAGVLLYHWVVGLPSWPREHVTQITLLGQINGFDITSKPWSKRIVAVGDLHGDLAHALKILRTADIVDDSGRWIAGDATLIQTGDIVDRGTDTIAIYRLFDTLRIEAAAAGGEVHSLLGNHEFMNVMGDWRYVTKEDIDTFHGDAARRRAFSSGWIGQTFLANYSVAAQVSYTPELNSLHQSRLSHASVVAVHGGIHPSWANVTRINEVGHRFLQRLVDARVPKMMALPRGTPPDEMDLYSATGAVNILPTISWNALISYYIGPLWYRGYALDSEEDGICEQAEEVLHRLNATRMIMGHTPQFKGIWSRCRSKVIVIDTAYGGPLSALEILYTLTPLKELSHSSGKANKVTEREVVTAIYEESRQILATKEKMVDLA